MFWLFKFYKQVKVSRQGKLNSQTQTQKQKHKFKSKSKSNWVWAATKESDRRWSVVGVVDSHSVDPRDQVLHALPLAHPALHGEDQRDQALEVLRSLVLGAAAVRTVGAALELRPLLLVKDQLASQAGTETYVAWGQVGVVNDLYQSLSV